MSEEMIPIFDENNNFVTEVESNYYLDSDEYQDSGFPGIHQGLVKISDSKYAILYVSQWEGDTNWGEVISPAEALWMLFSTRNDYLLQSVFQDLEYQVRNTLLVPRPGQCLPQYLIH